MCTQYADGGISSERSNPTGGGTFRPLMCLTDMANMNLDIPGVRPLQPQRRGRGFSRWVDFDAMNDEEYLGERIFKPATAMPMPISLEDLIVLQDVNAAAHDEYPVLPEQAYKGVALPAPQTQDEEQLSFVF